MAGSTMLATTASNCPSPARPGSIRAEIGLTVPDAERLGTLGPGGEAEQRAGRLDPRDLGAGPRQHPAEVAVTAARVQDAASGYVSEHPGQRRVDQVLLEEIALIGGLGKYRARHRRPPGIAASFVQLSVMTPDSAASLGDKKGLFGLPPCIAAGVSMGRMGFP
jgi:hypothetical protein